MGSTGTGAFTDYNQKTTSENENKCNKAFSTSLEEVERCEYFNNHSIVPIIGITVSVRVSERIEVIDSSGETLGYLPTKYNYIKNCIESGFSYDGIVIDSNSSPVGSIKVDITPD